MAKGRSAAPSQRQLRVGEELRHVISDVLARSHIHDPDLQEVPITVTEVRVSPDLRNATVFAVPLGGEREEAVIAALRRAAPFIRHEIARSLTLKFVPALRFELDTSFDAAAAIDDILHRPEVKRDLDEPADEDADDGA